MDSTSNQLHVGLEIGTTKVCVCVAEENGDGAPRILGVGVAPSRGVRKGEIVDSISAAECIRMAIREAEASSGIKIKKVAVAITGSHLRSFTSDASLIVPKEFFEKNSMVCFRAVEAMAREVPLPSDRLLLQAIDGSNICSDWHDGVIYIGGFIAPNEAGDKVKSSLGADCHIIHGMRSRIQRTLDCLESLQLEVVNLVPSSLAFDTGPIPKRKMSPTYLVVDLGGGTCDYIKIWAKIILISGVLAVGGDHITSDLSIGLRLPLGKAELLKVQKGSAVKRDSSHEEIITLIRDGQLPDYEIDRLSLDTIIQLRVCEIFEQIRDETFNYDVNNIQVGDPNRVTEVVLTGGVSELQGIAELAAQVFKVPVKLDHARYVRGSNKIIKNPAFTTAIGITKFAIEATSNPSMPYGGTKRLLEKPEQKTEFHIDQEYHSVLTQETDRKKNPSSTGREDLDIPTFLRKDTEGIEIKHAKKLE